MPPRPAEDPALQRIIAARFAFPTDEFPTWRTVLEPDAPENTPDPGRPDLHSDLAVVDDETGQVVMRAVFDPADDVHDETALQRWIPLAHAPGMFFLYVPGLAMEEASRICREMGIPVTGIRAWRRRADGGLTVEAAEAPSSLRLFLTALLPGPLRPARFAAPPPLIPAVPPAPPAPPEPPPPPVIGAAPRDFSRGLGGDLLLMFLIWAVLTAIAEILLVFVVYDIYFPAVGAEEAEDSDHAFKILTYLAAPVFGLVVAGLSVAALRFRSAGEPQEDGRPFLGGGLVPQAWLAITSALVIAVIIYPGLTGIAELKSDRENPDLVVDVQGGQFLWIVDYPEHDIQLFSGRDAMVLPNHARIQFNITSIDVLHSFWVPAFRMKIDAVPGETTEMWVTPTEVGSTEEDQVYRVQCAELCGTGHGVMAMDLRVVEPDEFDAWVAEKQAEASAAGPVVEAEDAETVDVSLVEWDVVPASDQVAAGPVTFRAVNDGTGTHELTVVRTDLAPDALPVEAGSADESQLEVLGRTAFLAPGEAADLTLDLEPGNYALICNIPGHYSLGMTVAFTVTG